MKCPKCKQEIDDNSVFCEYCGEKISQISTEEPKVEEKSSRMIPSPAKKRKWLKPTLFAIFGVILVIAAIFIIRFMSLGANEKKYFKMGMDYDKIAESRSESSFIRDPSTAHGQKTFYSSFGCRWLIAENGKCGLAGRLGEKIGEGEIETIEPCTHDYIGHDGGYNTASQCNCEIEELRFLVEDRGKMGFVDGNFNWIVSQNYQLTDPEHLYGYNLNDGYSVKPDPVFFSSGLQPLKNNKTGKWGYVNFYGNTVIPFVYEDAYPFCFDVARVKQPNGSWTYIKPDGESFRILTVSEEVASMFDNQIIVLDPDRIIQNYYSIRIIEGDGNFEYDGWNKGVVRMHVMNSYGYDFWILVDNEGCAFKKL